mgnify:CR=1 FL=1
MNKKPEISVVMPVYNSEKFLIEAIESILNQTYKNFELLLIYDDSSDNSLSIIKKFQEEDERIILVYGDGEKIVGALNKGIKKSKGRYIARMDSDDISLPSRFAKQITHMQNFSLDICGGHSLLIDKDNVINGLGVMPRSHDLCALSMIFRVPFPHPGVMIKKSFLIENNLEYGQSKYLIAEDFDMWVRMFSKGAKFGNIDDIIIQYRILDNSLSIINTTASKKDVKGLVKEFRLNHQKYLLKVIKETKINLLSEVEKSLIARYLINRALTRFDILGLNKLKGISLKNIVFTILSEINRLVTKI